MDISHRYRGYLPHIDHADYQMLTYRLADALPQNLLQQLQQQYPHSTGKQRQAIEEAIDQGYGACWLRHPATAAMVIENWRHFDGERYELIAYVVMPNHVHLLIRVYPDASLPVIVHSWKSYSAKIIRRQHPQAAAHIWQEDYWDRYIRDEAHYFQAIDYIHRNPVKAGLVSSPEQWPFSSAREHTWPENRVSKTHSNE